MQLPKSKHPPELVQQVYEMLQHNPEALDFVWAYGEQAEIADDMVDEPKDISKIQRLTQLAARIYSSDYWHRHKQTLLMIELLNNLTYFDTVVWEQSSDNWKRRDARCLNHCAYNMLFAVLILECGMDAVIESGITLRFRESAHLNQLEDIQLV